MGSSDFLQSAIGDASFGSLADWLAAATVGSINGGGINGGSTNIDTVNLGSTFAS
ncbi:hypothetical protein [Tomitella cavernea]|uniref:Uncharacterized protein n=1 Tax=Tomitella cavernea TaxID=1387982 RepID=A0ABP9D173_9ACTN|nr:hypothetical protein [Tomitella cavernea]